MNTINNKESNIKDIILWSIMALATFGVFYCSYKLNISTPIQAILWLSWVIIILLLGYQTSKGKQVFEFAIESKIELMKVVWPTRPETIQTTTIVMVMVTLTGFILWGIDSIMMWAIAKITHLG